MTLKIPWPPAEKAAGRRALAGGAGPEDAANLVAVAGGNPRGGMGDGARVREAAAGNGIGAGSGDSGHHAPLGLRDDDYDHPTAATDQVFDLVERFNTTTGPLPAWTTCLRRPRLIAALSVHRLRIADRADVGCPDAEPESGDHLQGRIPEDANELVGV